jgi:hypothetical protein
MGLNVLEALRRKLFCPSAGIAALVLVACGSIAKAKSATLEIARFLAFPAAPQ